MQPRFNSKSGAESLIGPNFSIANALLLQASFVEQFADKYAADL